MPMPPWIPSAITGASGLLSSALGIGASRSAEERAWQRNLQMMKLQNDFNVKMWNKTNQYNSPSNQLRLLKEAGINPAVFDANGGNSSASEVTAASGDVPNNSQIGQLYQSMDPSDKVISALQTDYQIQKLRTDIEYQRMLNKRYKMDFDQYSEVYAYDENGNRLDPIDVDQDGTLIYPTNMKAFMRGDYYNKWMSDKERSLAYRQSKSAANLSEDELEVYEAGMPFFKKMPEQQLRQLVTSIKTAALNNTLLSEDVKLMKEFGISPNDRDGWQSFLKAVLRNPDALGNVIDHLLSSGQSTIHRGVQRMRGYGYSHRNPSSW